MSEIKLLDCTLRDGGYINDWNFGHHNISSIYERLADSQVDYIEIGFLDDRRPYDYNRSIMPDTASVEKIYGQLDRKGAEIIGMIDYGTCDIANIQPCAESYLDGIRVIFKKHLMHEAMEYCRQLKALGYKVFSQLVSITSYNDDELRQLIALVNDVKPYAVSMVDTYGLLDSESLLHFYGILDAEVLPAIGIGFHAHNNFQLAYANCLAFLAAEHHHDVVVDGTLYGMGKSAGNAPLELLAMHLNDHFAKNYRINSMLESINECILQFYASSPSAWGYKPFFYMCALNKCHPSYLNYFQSKENLSISATNDLLGSIDEGDIKLLYDAKYAAQLYQNYYDTKCDDREDIAAFSREIQGKSILLIGPGRNISLQKELVEKYITDNDPYIIAINYCPEGINADRVFVTNPIRYRELTGINSKIIATSNVEARGESFKYRINRAPLIESEETIKDNSFLMLLKLLSSLGVNEVSCAGMDGYSEHEQNYFNPAMEYQFIKSQAINLNHHVRAALAQYAGKMQINFVTYSAYDENNEERHELSF